MQPIESNILLEGLKDAYRSNPSAHGNQLAIKLLVDAQQKISEEMGDTEERIEAAEQRSYDQGFDEGRESAFEELSEHLDMLEEFIDKIRKLAK